MNIVTQTDNFIKIENVLISVWNKDNIEYLILNLIDLNDNIKIYSTGGTYKKIEEILKDRAKKHLIKVSDYTKQKEMQGGLVKTLDFKIYLGLLSETYNEEHKKDLKRTESVEFDLLVSNLYPFAETISKKDVTIEEARGNIDIGGPTMIRAASKNFLRVAPVISPEYYKKVIDFMKDNDGKIDIGLRFELSQKAFEYITEYDKKISDYLNTKSIKDVLGSYTF